MSKKVNISPRPAKSSEPDNWVESRVAVVDDQPRVKPKRLTIDIDPELHTQLKVHCAKNGVQIADWLRKLIIQGLVVAGNRS
ncbi:MAG: plasmid partition protein ParG [Pirellulaceae bacterium]